MHPRLKDAFDATIQFFRDDPRVLAAYMGGSVGTPDEDEFSDVDPVFVVRREDFEQVDADLPGIFERLCGPVVLYWPERANCDTWRNYAVLFDADGCLLQYDVTIEVAPPDGQRDVWPGQLLFDKAGVLRLVQPANDPFPPRRLLWTVQIFWVYAYIHAKYLRRGDVFKLLYAQAELFQAHLEVLRALEPKVKPGWWPRTVGALSRPDAQDALFLYHGHRSPDSVAAALPVQLDRFSRDARLACTRWAVAYPEAVEKAVRAHLGRVCSL